MLPVSENHSHLAYTRLNLLLNLYTISTMGVVFINLFILPFLIHYILCDDIIYGDGEFYNNWDINAELIGN